MNPALANQQLTSTIINFLCVACVQYTIFGEVTKGMQVLDKLLEKPTRKSGIFVM